ncbi:MAG: HAMP domain-containing histidine kinase [Melioribacteraceae bacterium]|nr:HAMP domain-containing histidine kinase [Melioribacteraceae bacterium]
MKIIEGETNRLTRLIDNVLDLTKIEKNLKEYQFEEIELAEVVDEVLDILEYQIIMSGLKITKTTSGEKLKVYADKDAVIRSVINLINNAIKFSTGKKEIAVSTYCQNSLACIEVKDFGT